MQKIQCASLGIAFPIGSLHCSEVYYKRLNNWMKIISLFMFLKSQRFTPLQYSKRGIKDLGVKYMHEVRT